MEEISLLNNKQNFEDTHQSTSTMVPSNKISISDSMFQSFHHQYNQKRQQNWIHHVQIYYQLQDC